MKMADEPSLTKAGVSHVGTIGVARDKSTKKYGMKKKSGINKLYIKKAKRLKREFNKYIEKRAMNYLLYFVYLSH